MGSFVFMKKLKPLSLPSDSPSNKLQLQYPILNYKHCRTKTMDRQKVYSDEYQFPLNRKESCPSILKRLPIDEKIIETERVYEMKSERKSAHFSEDFMKELKSIYDWKCSKGRSDEKCEVLGKTRDIFEKNIKIIDKRKSLLLSKECFLTENDRLWIERIKESSLSKSIKKIQSKTQCIFI